MQHIDLFERNLSPVSFDSTTKNLSSFLDLSKDGSVFIFGDPGVGKSNLLHNIILSLTYLNSPEQLNLILIDTNIVEFSIYEKLGHLIYPIINSSKKSIDAIQFCVNELLNRKKILDKLHLNDISQYYSRNKNNIKKIPNILIIIDEYSEIITEYPQEFKNNVTKLLHKGKEYGIYLIFSTSSQNKLVLPFDLKIWISNYILFRTNIQIYKDQNTENLLNGEMLYVTSKSNKRYIKVDYLDNEYIWKKTQSIKQKHL